MDSELTVGSPVGPLTITADDGRITGILMDAPARTDSSSPVLREAAAQLDAYFAGGLQRFDLPLAPRGTPFQRRVWDALLTVGFGQTATYGQIAEQIGAPTAARAVGMANARNPIAIVVPCHRVIGASGKLTGYAGGLDRKAFLLALETRAYAFQSGPA